ncbi:MAG: flippase-like domain-containing protein [Sphingomonadales bacterium]|nr:flippase-like domain-containing protein [Sphingomonadales bacterium]
MEMSKRLKITIQYIFFLALGVFFTWLSVKNLNQENRQQIQQALSSSRQWLIVPVFLMLVFSHYLRALRWRLLLQPLGHRPSIVNTFLTVLMGYLINLGVPRLGELAKCTLLARYEKIPAEQLVGTIITERLIDAVSLVLVFALTLGLQPSLYGQLLITFFPNSASTAGGSSSGTLFLVVVAVGSLFVAYWVGIKKRKLVELQQLISTLLRRVYAGVSSIAALQQRGSFILLSISIWALYLLAGYIGFFAFKETANFGLPAALTILSAGSIGMIASPGGIGAYAFLLEKSMQLYGLPYPIALAFGWLLWLAQTSVTILSGFVSFIVLPLYNKK